MSTDAINVELQPREVIKKGLRKLRDSGQLPVVIHDHGKPSTHAMGDTVQLSKTYVRAGKHHPVEITIGNVKHLALIKDVDIEPVKNRLRHIVFQAIKQDEKVEAEVPIHLDGEIPAERAGLMVLKQLDYVTIEALPKYLIDEIKIDATGLAEIGDTITVADIKIPEGVEIMTDPTHSIATVEEPKVQIEEPEVTEEEVSAAEVPSEHGEPGSEETKTEE